MSEKRDQTTKTIGILGGMGPAGTADFYRRIIQATDARCDQEHLHVLIDSYPQTPDRTAFVLGDGEDPTPTLLAIAQRLELAGAEILTIACNTAHTFIEPLSTATSVPVIDWVNEACAGVVSYVPHIQRVGLLGTTGTIESGLYQRSFATYDMQVIVPELRLQKQVMTTIYGNKGIKAGHISPQSASRIIELATDFFLKNHAQVILLACTELSLLFATHPTTSRLPILDASQLVAERLVVLAGGQLKRCEEPSELPIALMDLAVEKL